MKLVVAKVQGGVDWLERLKVDIDLLLLAFLCHNGATIYNQPIGWHCQEKNEVTGKNMRNVLYRGGEIQCSKVKTHD